MRTRVILIWMLSLVTMVSPWLCMGGAHQTKNTDAMLSNHAGGQDDDGGGSFYREHPVMLSYGQNAATHGTHSTADRQGQWQRNNPIPMPLLALTAGDSGLVLPVIVSVQLPVTLADPGLDKAPVLYRVASSHPPCSLVSLHCLIVI